MLSAATVLDALIDATVKSSILIALAWLAARVLRPSQVALRTIWVGVTFALLMILFASAMSLAQWEVAVPVTVSGPSVLGAAPDFSFEEVLVEGWGLGVVAFSAVFGVAHLRLRRLLGRSSIADTSGNILVQVSETAGVSRGWRLLVSPNASGPFTCGLIRPTVVLPRDFHKWTEG